jgi:hypothetical protein
MPQEEINLNELLPCNFMEAEVVVRDWLVQPKARHRVMVDNNVE